jgi:hypothetical protein
MLGKLMAVAVLTMLLANTFACGVPPTEPSPMPAADRR